MCAHLSPAHGRRRRGERRERYENESICGERCRGASPQRGMTGGEFRRRPYIRRVMLGLSSYAIACQETQRTMPRYRSRLSSLIRLCPALAVSVYALLRAQPKRNGVVFSLNHMSVRYFFSRATSRFRATLLLQLRNRPRRFAYIQQRVGIQKRLVGISMTASERMKFARYNDARYCCAQKNLPPNRRIWLSFSRNRLPTAE